MTSKWRGRFREIRGIRGGFIGHESHELPECKPELDRGSAKWNLVSNSDDQHAASGGHGSLRQLLRRVANTYSGNGGSRVVQLALKIYF
jgi:hypothetical protein